MDVIWQRISKQDVNINSKVLHYSLLNRFVIFFFYYKKVYLKKNQRRYSTVKNIYIILKGDESN